MNTITRLVAAWMLPGLLLVVTARSQHASPASPVRHLAATVVCDQSQHMATIEVRVNYPVCLSLSLQGEQDRNILRIALNKRLDTGTHRFTVSTEGLRPGIYTLRLQDGSDVKTQSITVR